MTTLLTFASKCSWTACAVCAILAILAVPQSARADEYTTCMEGCQSMIGDPMAYTNCVNGCNAAVNCPTYDGQCYCASGDTQAMCVNRNCSPSTKCDCTWLPGCYCR